MASDQAHADREIEKKLKMAQWGITRAIQKMNDGVPRFNADSTVNEIKKHLVKIIMCDGVASRMEHLAMNDAVEKIHQNLQDRAKAKPRGHPKPSASNMRKNLKAFLMGGITSAKKNDDSTIAHADVTYDLLERHYSELYDGATCWLHMLRFFAEAIAGADRDVMDAENRKKRKRADELWGGDFSDIEEPAQTSEASAEAH